MSNYSLLLMSGNAKIGVDYIDYIGVEDKKHLEIAEAGNLPPIPPPVPADIRSNININDGELTLTYCLHHSTSYFSVNLWSHTDNLILTFNEYPNLFSVKRIENNMLTPLYPAGSSSASKINLPTRLSIQNSSGIITISVDEVVVGKLPFPNNGLSVSFSAFGGYGLRLSDISVKGKTPKAFVVMQFQQDYNELYKEVIKPVCESMGLEVIRADESLSNSSIIEEIIAELTGSKVIIADITPDNPNVYYEVGYAHALKKDVILMCNEQRGKLPFDLVDIRTIFYKNSIAGNALVKEKLKSRLSIILGDNNKK